MTLLELDTWTSPVNWAYLLTSALVVFFLADHLSTLRKRKSLPGPLFAWPFFGAIFEMVWDPTNFWDRQETFGPLSWNALFGKFMVFSRDTDTSIKIFKHNSPEELKIVLHPNAVRLLGEDNIAFMQGPGHKELRKRLLPLFTKKALGVYLNIQEKAIREHLANVRQSAFFFFLETQVSAPSSISRSIDSISSSNFSFLPILEVFQKQRPFALSHLQLR